MTLSITVTKPSYDKVYIMQAWEDSNHKLVLVQGEGVTTSSGTAARSKEPRFLLQDRNGAIDLTSCTVTLALHRPDNTEDLLACTVISPATDGMVKCPITASATAIAGDATGEIRVSSTNGTIKFYGIHFKIFPGVSNSAIELSAAFSALTAALQKVGVLTPSGTITLDDAIRENGTDPVSSGVIYEALTNYVPKTRTIAGINLADNIVAGDLRSALKTPQVYQRTRVPTSGDGEEVGQFWIATLTDANSRKYYEIYQLYEFYTESNAPTVTLRRWKKICDIDEVVPKTRTIAGINLADNITAGELLDALEDNGGDFANMSWHEDEYAPSAVNTEYPVPMIWHNTSDDVYYIVYGKEVTSNGCAYSSYQIPKITVGVGSPNSSSVTGHIYIDVSHDSAYLCFGGTTWHKIPVITGLYDYVRGATHIDSTTGNGIIPTSSTAGAPLEEWWTKDTSNNYVCYRMVAIDDSGDTPRYIWKQVVDESRRIAGLDLHADITVEALLAAIQDSNVAWHESEYAPSVTNGELPVPLLWHNTSDDIYYIVYNKEWTSDGWAYSSYQIPKTVIGVNSPSFSGTAGQLYIDISHRSLFMCFGGTTWYEIPVNNGFFDYVRCTMHVDAATGDGIAPTDFDIGVLADEWWTIDANNNYVCYRMVSIDDSGDTPRYIWKQYGAPPKYPEKFAYTINANGWNNGAYTLSGQMVGVADGRHKVDIDINEATFLQLQSDGCYGLYVETDLSGSTPVYTLHAIGNVPSVTIIVQMTVSQVIEVLG